jgi:hypothetical protein
VNKLTTFFEEMNYDIVMPYLVEGHQNKMNRAVNNSDVEQVRIPGASLNPKTMNCSGDYFKSTDDITTKIEITIGLKYDNSWISDNLSEEVVSYYEDYLDLED